VESEFLHKVVHEHYATGHRDFQRADHVTGN